MWASGNSWRRRSYAFRIGVSCAVTFGLVAAASEGIDGSEGKEQALFGGMPDDEGRLEVFGFCGTCHSIDLVLQQGLTRAVWDDVLVEMVRDQEMAPLRDDDRRKVLDYLEKYYGPDRRAKKAAPSRQAMKPVRTPWNDSTRLSANLHWSRVD